MLIMRDETPFEKIILSSTCPHTSTWSSAKPNKQPSYSLNWSGNNCNVTQNITSAELPWSMRTRCTLLPTVIGRIYGLKQEGGELFINDFHKLWRYNEIQWWITEKETKEAKEQNWLSWFPKNQPVVFAIQPVVLSAVNKKQLKTNIKEFREWDNHTKRFIQVHSYPKSYIQFPETTRYPLCNQSQITNTQPPKKWSWSLQEHTLPLAHHNHTTDQNTLWLCEHQYLQNYKWRKK